MSKENQELSRVEKIKLAKQLLLKKGGRSEKKYTMSSQQKRMWFVSQSDQASVAYNLRMILHVEGQVDLSCLERSVKTVFNRHPIFSTRYELIDDTPTQCIDPKIKPDVARVNLVTDDTISMENHVAQEANQKFDLEKGHVAKARIYSLSDQHAVLLLVIHHIATDSVSMDVIRSELVKCYQGFLTKSDQQLADLSWNYGNYSEWQDEFKKSEDYNMQLDYWQDQLRDLPTISNILTDRTRPAERQYLGLREPINFDAELKSCLVDACKQHGVTRFMYLLACFKLTLAILNRNSDVVVGTTIANRDVPETQNIVGNFVNNLILRTRVDWSGSFTGCLQSVKQSCLDAYSHSQIPFDDIVDAIKPERSSSYSPLFQNMFTFHGNKSLQRVDSDRLSVNIGDPQYTTSIFELTLDLVEREDCITGHLEYDTVLYDKNTVKKLIELFQNIIRRSLDNSDESLASYNLVSKEVYDSHHAGRKDILQELKSEDSLLSRIKKQVELTPDAPAINDYAQCKLSYSELWTNASKIAHAIRHQRQTESPVVGVALERSSMLPVTLLGIMMADAIYLPIEQELPQERINYLLSDSGCEIVITQSILSESSLSEPVVTIFLDEILAGYECECVFSLSEMKNNTAYIIYTSGTTGKPKGVAVGHKALLNRLEWMQSEYKLSNVDSVLHKTPISFDVSVWELLWPFFTGANLFVAEPGAHREPEKLNLLIKEQSITTLHFVPTMLDAMIEHIDPEAWKSVSNVICSGEKLEKALVEAFLALPINAKIHNLYGPTEAAIDVTYFDCANHENYTNIPIGKCISNIDIEICAPNGNTMPNGLFGEILISGVGLAEGYVNKPELTSDRFVEYQRFGQSVRFYKTGDLGRYLPDGNIEFWGRRDSQIKIRGIRVELEEIQRTISSLDLVGRARVITQKSGTELAIHAFITLDESIPAYEKTKIEASIFQQLNKILPAYMVPATITVLTEFPSGANGKVDDKELLELIEIKADANIVQSTDKVLTELEQAIIDIVSELLKIESSALHISDSFIDKGGNSLMAMKLMARIEKNCDVKISVMDIFELDSLEAIADYVKSSKDVSSHDSEDMQVLEF